MPIVLKADGLALGKGVLICNTLEEAKEGVRTIMAVSYTHLDVYKRQLYSNDASKLLPRPISLCGIDAEAGTLRLVYRVTGEGTGTEAVSYTHLDVYKRQVIPRSRSISLESMTRSCTS